MYCGYQGTGTYDTTRSATDDRWTITGCGYSRIGSFLVTAVVRDCWRDDFAISGRRTGVGLRFLYVGRVHPLNVRAVYGVAALPSFKIGSLSRRKRGENVVHSFKALRDCVG